MQESNTVGLDTQENSIKTYHIMARNLTRLSENNAFEICTTTKLYPIAKNTVFVGEGSSIWILDSKGNKVTELKMNAFKCYHPTNNPRF